MGKLINNIPELQYIMDINKFHTFDDTGEGFSTSSNCLETIEIEINGGIYSLYLYSTEQGLYSDTILNLNSMDLSKGGDNQYNQYYQYYHYSPSQVEAVMYAIPLLTPEHQIEVASTLLGKIQDFIKKAQDDLDGEMIIIYQHYLSALTPSNLDPIQILEKLTITLDLQRSNHIGE